MLAAMAHGDRSTTLDFQIGSEYDCLRKYSNSEAAIYMGCHERGKVMAEVVLPDGREEFTMKTATLVANGSLASCEASFNPVPGLAITGYFRDMGKNASMTADSTSRWVEILSALLSHLSELPGDSGCLDLCARLASFCDCAGKVKCLESLDQAGSVRTVGSDSPLDGVLSDHVMCSALNTVQMFCGIDQKLAQRKDFSSANWPISYSKYTQMDNGDKHIRCASRKNTDELPQAKKQRTKLQTGAEVRETPHGFDQDSTVESDAEAAAVPVPPTPEIAGIKAVLHNLYAQQSPSIVTVVRNIASSAEYFTGFVLLSGTRYCLIFTFAELARRKARQRAFDVYFGSDKKEAHVLHHSLKENFMILFVLLKDGESHRAVTFTKVPAEYESVVTLGAMAGTMLHPNTHACHQLTGAIGIYQGQVTTPSCSARDGKFRHVPGSEKYFMLNCHFQNDIICLWNIDNKLHPATRIMSAPIFRMNGEVIGVICGTDECSDAKVALHTAGVISCISRLCGVENGWEEQLKNESIAFLAKRFEAPQ